jgi:hypothetical protein
VADVANLQLVGGGVGDLVLDLLAWAPARQGRCALALAAQGSGELHTSTNVVKHVMRSSWSLSTMLS